MMMRKITTFLLLVCMLVGVFGKVNVYAASSTESSFNDFVFNFRLIDEYGDYKYKVDVTDSDSYKIIHVINNSMHSAVIISKNTFSYTRTYIVDWLTNDSYATDTATGTAACCSGNSDDAIVYLSNVIIGGDCTLTGSFYGTFDATGYSGDELYQAYYDILCGNFPDGFTRDPSEFDEDSAIYDENLGSLKNIKRYAIKYTDGGSSSTGTIDYTWKYTYASTTTTGFNLSTDGASVQYVIKKKGGYKTLLGDYYSLPTVISDYFLAESGKKYFYISSDILNSLIKSFRTSDVPLSATLDYTDYVYLRPVFFNGTNYCYGNWSRTYVSEKGSLIIENGITDGDGGAISSEDDGDDDDFTPNGETDESPVGTGDGTSLEDAEDNLIDSLSDFSSLFKNFISEMTALQESLGKIPALIGNVFTAFPDGVITAIGLGFIIVIFLRVLGR